MLHTAEITARIPYATFCKLIKTGKFEKHEQNHFTTEYFKNEGINQIRIRYIDKPDYKEYRIMARINIPRLALKEKFTDILTKESVQVAVDKFNLLMYELHPDIPEMKLWHVRRIDYAIDISTEYVLNYIILFQRGRIPNNFKIKLDDNNHRNHKPGSLYLANDSVHINFYDKQNELLRKGVNDKCIINRAEKILRLEVQCMYSKTTSIKEKFVLPTKSIVDFLNENISSKMIIEYYEKTVGGGDFYTLEEARKIIEKSKFSRKKKDKLIDMLNGIASSKGVQNYLDKLDIKEKKAAAKYIEELALKLNLNSITIPREWKIKKLNSLIPDITQYNLRFKKKNQSFTLIRGNKSIVINRGSFIEIY